MFFMSLSCYVGMHMAAFDDGSRAALELFAEELLDLWNNPINVDEQLYYVVLGQILMDDKGRESACGVQGATSLAGCNICHFEGRTFAKRRVFDGMRRYKPMQDKIRNKNSAKNTSKNFQFSFDEKRNVPRKRSYEEYKDYAAQSVIETRGRQTKVAVCGVKELWAFDVLPYANSIHWTVDMMHVFNNVICDMINSCRPTNSGSKKLYKHKNRTISSSVINACKEEGIYEEMTDGSKPNPPWILSRDECLQVDSSIGNVRRPINYV